MKNKLRLLITTFFFFFTTQALSNPIDKINFIGLNNAQERSLLKILPFKNGQELTDSSSNEIIQSLFKTGLFSDIGVSLENTTLKITVKENPIVKYFDFDLDSDKGLSAWLSNEKPLLDNEALNELLKNEDLSPSNIFTKRKLNNFLSILESKYIESGYFNVLINLTIDQGKQAKIGSFSVIGAVENKEDELLKLFAIGEPNMPLVNYFTKKDLYTDAEFRKGIDAMTNYYYDSGYLDFKINDVETVLDNSKEKIDIKIQVSEGIQYVLGKISFNGEFAGLSAKELNQTLDFNQGETFNRASVINSIQLLTDLFADKGFAFVEINPITSESLNIVDIEFNISLNKKVYINRISISGNTRTQDEVIRREIGISEGGLYSRSVLRDSLLKLRRLGYFSDVQISTSEVEGMPDKIDIAFNVSETQTGAVSFSMSHSNNYGISFGAGIQEKNIFGSGNTLNADLKISESFNKISFYFMNPNFNDQGHSLSIGAFKSEIDDDDIAINSYEIDSTGATFGYGIPLSNDTRLNGDLEFSKNEIKCSSLFSGSNYESSQCASSENDEFKATVSWNQNTLNNYLYPTEGSNNNLIGSVSLPLGDYRYFNLGLGHTSYAPLNETLTLKLSGDLNLAKGYDGKELPFYKRYFGGGSGSVRGFGNKTLGPTYPNGKAKGGELSILGSANLITPAFFFDNNEKMRMSAFIDAGNIFEKSSNVDLGDIRMSTGFGFAYLSPIGSIGAFISTPILKKDGDVIEDFGFSLGTGF